VVDGPNGLSNSKLELATLLQNEMVSRATGGLAQDSFYQKARRDLINDPSVRDKLPPFVKTHRSLDSFWTWIKNEAGTYAERRAIIYAAFAEVLDFLESQSSAPHEQDIAAVLGHPSLDSISTAWAKALERRESDPEGAITSSRTLLESVCKTILDERHVTYSDRDDLPKLYGLVSAELNLAPDKHSEEIFKTILGGCRSVVVGLGSLRNKLSDAHGKGSVNKTRPSARHAALAVNLSGSMAMFLLETHNKLST